MRTPLNEVANLCPSTAKTGLASGEEQQEHQRRRRERPLRADGLHELQ